MDAATYILLKSAIRNGGGSKGVLKDWREFRAAVRQGKIMDYVDVGELLVAEKESGVYVTIQGSGITAASVDEETFLAATTERGTLLFEFMYDGAAWHYGDTAVELSHYGVSVTGTPATGDAVIVHEQAGEVYLEFADGDYDVPVNTALTHCATLITRDILSYGTIPFSRPQALKAIAADEFPDGIAAGTTLHITLDHGCYDATTKQDGTYQFTTPVAIPVGGKIRHSQIGIWKSDESQYTKDAILSGTFTIYDASYNTLASGIATAEGSDGTDLGTCTAETKSYMVGSHLNSTRRQAYGSNRAAHSAQLKWLKSAAAGAGSGQIASWWYASDEFDMPVRSTLPGWRHGLDPELVAVLTPVRKRVLLHAWDRTGSETYEDLETDIFQLSMTEIGFGANSGVYECSVKADGTLNKTGAYALFDGATNEDRIKTDSGGTARYWFHRSPYPSYAINVRYTGASGALYYYNASSAHEIVAGLPIG